MSVTLSESVIAALSTAFFLVKLSENFSKRKSGEKINEN